MPTPRKKTSSFTERVKKAAQMTAEEQAAARNKAVIRNEENVPSKKRKPSQRRTDSTQQRRSKSSNTRNSEDISAHCSKQNDKPRRRTTANLTESQDTYKRLNGKSSKQSRTNTRNQSRNTDSAASKSNRQTARNSQNIKLERISTQENSQSGGTNKRSKRDHIAPKKEGLVSGKLQALRNLPKRTISLTIIVILIVASCAIVYPVGKTWYKSLRDEQRQTAILEAENARNEELSKANEALKTEEGIEDEARKSGYVKKGEKSVSVSNGSDSGDTSTGLPAQIDETKIHAPQTWYYKILDTIFFVES